MDTEFSLGGRNLLSDEHQSSEGQEREICRPDDTCVFANLHSDFLFIFFKLNQNIFSYCLMFLVKNCCSNNSEYTAIYINDVS
jgi:hypothetical protein